MRYQIVNSPSLEMLQSLVSKAMEEGWSCQGSPQMQVADGGRTMWIQAMTRAAAVPEEAVRLKEPKRK